MVSVVLFGDPVYGECGAVRNPVCGECGAVRGPCLW